MSSWAALAVLLVVAATRASAAAADPPTNAPPSTAPATSVQNEPVRYGHAVDPATGRAAAPAALDAAADLWHVVLALVVVVSIIFALRWAARKMALVPDAGRPGKGVRVLSRTILSPKQQVLLLQVGRRVIVVGDGGSSGMRPLCEIDDPDEVAALIGEARTSQPAAPARSFASLFRRAADPFDTAAEPALPPPVPEPQMHGDVAGLLDKVRGLRQQFEQ